MNAYPSFLCIFNNKNTYASLNGKTQSNNQNIDR